MTDRRTLRLTKPFMTGDDVREMQTLINRALEITNSCMGVDGVFGQMTDRRVARFQNAAKIRVDGICGPKTWAKLYEMCRALELATYSCTSTMETLQITDDIALWLMRMVVGEGGRRCSRKKAAALLWAIINRWFLWPGSDYYDEAHYDKDTGRDSDDDLDFVREMRAFSQPINPRWMTGGDKLEEYHHKGPASPARVARREEICAMQRGDFQAIIMQAVDDFASGKLPYPELSAKQKRISNWASLKSTPKKYPWGVDIGGDWFFEDSNLRDGEVVVR